LLAQQCPDLLPLTFLAYLYGCERLGEKRVQRGADDRRHDALTERLDLDRCMHPWRAEAAVDLLGSRKRKSLLGGQRNAHPFARPRLFLKNASGVALDVLPGKVEVADIEDAPQRPYRASEKRHDVRVQEPSDLAVRSRDSAEVLGRDCASENTAERARLADDQRRRRVAPTVDAGIVDGVGEILANVSA
jgi:hypothetical protein